MQKVCCILINSDDEFKETMLQNEKFGIERGLKASLNIDLYNELTKMFNPLSKKGYYVTGFILDSDKGIEFLFQRDKKQLSSQKLKEIQVSDKYKM